MKLTAEELWPELWDAALDLEELELWNEFDEDDVFAARLPDEDYPWFITIPSPDETGGVLFMTRGKNGYRDMAEMGSGSEDGGDLADQVRLISAHVAEPDDVPPAMELMPAEDEDEDDDLVPYIIVKEPGLPPSRVSEPDALRCLMVIKGIIHAHAEGLLDQVENFLPDAPVVTLALSGDPASPAVSAEMVSYQAAPRLVSAYLPEDREELQKLKKLGKTWKVGYWYLPVAGEDRTRSVHCLGVVQDGKLIKRVMLAGRDLGEAARHLFETMKGANDAGVKGRPKKMIFSGASFFETVAPALRELGVNCALQPENDEIASAYEETLIEVHRELMLAQFEAMVAEPEPNYLPRPDDAAAWARVNAQVTARVGREMMLAAQSPDKALKEYFGDLEAASFHLFEDEEEEDDEGPGLAMMCFGEWFCFHYRSGKKDRTAAERMLEQDLPAAQRLALEARARARVSLYTVEKIGDDGSLTLTDVLFGGTARVQDEALAETAAAGMGLPLRVFRLGDFHFCALIGPGLEPFQISEAVGFLLGRGMGDDPARAGERAHFFGLLWDWLEDRMEEMEDEEEDYDGFDENEDEDSYGPAFPGPAPNPANVREMQGLLDEFYLKWLDLPLPGLGGKTPRQAARAPEGKRIVAILIRSLAPPPGQPGLTVPRERMLKELGMDRE